MPLRSPLQGLISGSVDLASSREVSGENWCNEGAEDNLGTAVGKHQLYAKEEWLWVIKILPSDWECEPQNEKELEGVVERKPVYNSEHALEHSQESEDNPVLYIHISAIVEQSVIFGLLTVSH